jgi:hypothetical protein
MEPQHPDRRTTVLGLDPWAERAVARRMYLAAVAARDGATRGTPEYRKAVQRLGNAWWRLRQTEDAVASVIGDRST